MIFLGIESSCDESAAALIQDQRIIAHQVHSQNHTHSGGVIPQVAAREHLKILPCLMQQMMQKADLRVKDIGGIGVTSGPGLVGGLLIGIMYAKGLSLSSGIPLWSVHHLAAHALVVRREHKVDFPYLLLLLSGGHCLMAIVHQVDRYQILGQTQDDAVGECLDKVARALEGPYPGGAWIEAWAKEGDSCAIDLPITRMRHKIYDFSFSGLKTACLLWIQKNQPMNEQKLRDFCASLQRVIAQSLCRPLERALKTFGIERCVVSGGVASNLFFRSALEDVCHSNHVQFYAPSPFYCTDNGVMVAWAAWEYYCAGIKPNLDFSAQPYWPLDLLAHDESLRL